MTTAVAARDLAGPLFAHGFSVRKRPLVRGFTGRGDVHFVVRGRDVQPGATLLLWGSAPVPAGTPGDVRVVRMEDGFVRSVGLGADLTRPMSWVIDELGIYYDPSHPSALEQILLNAAFDAEEIARAECLRRRIVDAGLTKYNLSARAWKPRIARRPVVLVPGQVETDASIARGAVDIRTNLGLLQAVRAARPDAWVVYKPHPDVVAGLRSRGLHEADASRCCDELVLEGSMHQILQQVDEVHVLTSLTGFEALLRELPVTCWGLPFYAGWGLTHDVHAHPRRTRRLALAELVSGALLRYPVYLSRTTGERCTPERALDELLQWRAEPSTHDAWWRRLVRPLISRR